MARVISPDGTETSVTAKGRKFTLEEVQGFVGGLIEQVPTVNMPKGGKVRMWVDEEGLLKGYLVNEVATRMAGMVLVGDVFILERGDHF